MPTYIYIIYSLSANKYYVGFSTDPWRRLAQHNENELDKYTGKYSNWELRAVFEVEEGPASAQKLEIFIKKQKSRVLIERLIDTEFKPEGVLAQLVRVPHVRD
jgi:putative endonuclease